MRAFAIRSSDIDRCPKRSMLPAHYRDDGTCLCKTAKVADRWPHGTRARYTFGGCRCEPCTEANREYARWRGRAETYPDVWGAPDRLVDAAPVKAHLRLLARHGVGLHQVVKLTGLNRNALIKMLRRSKRCHRSTAEKVLSVSIEDAADGAYIDGKETWRLITELLKAGYSKKSIGQAATASPRAQSLQVKAHAVTRTTAKRIEAFHDVEFFVNARLRQVCRCKGWR